MLEYYKWARSYPVKGEWDENNIFQIRSVKYLMVMIAKRECYIYNKWLTIY